MAQEFGAVPSVPSLGFPGEITDDLLQIAQYVWVGTGSPEGTLAAPVGSIYLQRDGGTETAMWRKEGGETGSSGWIAGQFIVQVGANLVTNPGFEVDTSNWTATNGTLARVTTPSPFAGSGMARMTSADGNSMVLQSDAMTVLAGAEYIYSVALKTAVAPAGVNYNVRWYNSVGAEISVVGSSLVDVTDEWQSGTIISTAPATAVTAKVEVSINPAAASEQHYVDGFFFARTSPPIIANLATGEDPYGYIKLTEFVSQPTIQFWTGTPGEYPAEIRARARGSTLVGLQVAQRGLFLYSGYLNSSESTASLDLQAENAANSLPARATLAAESARFDVDSITHRIDNNLEYPLVSLLDRNSVRGGSDTTYDRTATSFAAVDSGNLFVAFLSPASGVVIVKMTAHCYEDSSNYQYWRLQTSGGTAVSNTEQIIHSTGNGALCHYSQEVTGLTAGQTYTWVWAFRSDSAVNGVHIRKGPTFGEPRMEVWGVLE